MSRKGPQMPPAERGPTVGAVVAELNQVAELLARGGFKPVDHGGAAGAVSALLGILAEQRGMVAGLKHALKLASSKPSPAPKDAPPA